MHYSEAPLRLIFAEGEGETTAPASAQPEMRANYSAAAAEAAKAAGMVPDAGEPMIETPPEPTREDRRKAYDDFIRGEGKEFYQEDTQALINRRFRENKEQAARMERLEAIADRLHTRYGTSDLDALTSALEKDADLYRDAAEQMGMEPEAYADYQRTKMENARLQRQMQQQSTERQINEQLQRWMQEEKDLQGKIKGFSLQAEATNPQFAELLKKGVPMEHAYRMIHFDEIMQAERDAQEKAVMDRIRARGTRPAEEGAAPSSAPFTAEADVAKMDWKKIREIAERAKNGENIRL